MTYEPNPVIVEDDQFRGGPGGGKPDGHRLIRLAAIGVAVTAVAGVGWAGAALSGDPAAAGAPGPERAALPAATPVPAGAATPAEVTTHAARTDKVVVAGKGYQFQNRPPGSVATVPVDGRVRIATHYSFGTRGTQWAVIGHLPGEAPDEPFGWRATVGNSNLGRPGQPGVQGVGSPTRQVFSSVFRSEQAASVVFTREKEAWHGKLYRLAGIPGWVQASVEMRGVRGGRHASPNGVPRIGVFVYDKEGKLLTSSSGAGRNPLPLR